MHLPYCDLAAHDQPDREDDFEREWRFAEPLPHDGTGWGSHDGELPREPATHHFRGPLGWQHPCEHLLGASIWYQRAFYEEFHDQELGLRPNVRVFEDICARIAETSGLDLSDVMMEIDAGEVRLEGTVATRREKCLLAKLVWSVRGVREVSNHIRIRLSPEWEPRTRARRETLSAVMALRLSARPPSKVQRGRLHDQIEAGSPLSARGNAGIGRRQLRHLFRTRDAHRSEPRR